jgi:DnaK suppressor protein
MDQEIDIEAFKLRLLAARQALLELTETRRQSSATVELDQSRTGRLSRMDAMQLQAMGQAGEQRAALALRRIEAALRRCETGEYGLCVECEEPIAVKRLEADPATPLCVQCAQAREQGR